MGEIRMDGLEGEYEQAESEEEAALLPVPREAEQLEEDNKLQLPAIPKWVQEIEDPAKPRRGLQIADLLEVGNLEAKARASLIVGEALGGLRQGIKLAEIVDAAAPRALGGLQDDIRATVADAALLGMRGYLAETNRQIEQIKRQLSGEDGFRQAANNLFSLRENDLFGGPRLSNNLFVPSVSLESVTSRFADTFRAIDHLAEEQDRRAREAVAAAFAGPDRWVEQDRQIRETIAAFASLEASPAMRRSQQQVYLPSKTPAWLPSPSRTPRRPNSPAKPPKPLDGEQIPERDWQAAITLAIKQGKVSPAELIKLALQHNHKAPGLIPPEWTEIEAVALAYKERGHRYDSQEAFVGYLARMGFSLSLATFKRWVTIYETVTGECIRPGKGRRKRPSM